VTIDWRERQKLFRIAYPLAGARFEYEIAAGWAERPDDGREVSGQRWVRAVRAGANVTVINDAKYSYSAREGVLYITALRSPVYSHHDPVKLQEGAVYRYLDQGEHRFTVRIDATGAATRQDAMRLADDLINPPVATPQVARGGKAAPLGQWLKAETLHGAVTALKLAEDSDALILRAIELDGAPDQLRIGDAEVGIRPRGIVTVALAADGLKARDGLER
jgi:alpha-mannosidase